MTAFSEPLRCPILVIDDDPRVCVVAVSALNGAGYPAVAVDTVREGLRLLRTDGAWCALVGFELQGTDGVDAVISIHEIDPDVKVVGLLDGRSRVPVNTQEQLLSALNIRHFVEKPLSEGHLIDMIERIIRRSSS